MKNALLVITLWVASAGVGTASAAPSAAPALGDLSKVGSVHFPTTCDPAVQKEFERGLALLHSFFYEEARRVFTSVAEKDPQCAIAQWGIAMSYWHPIWTPPDSSELTAGRAAVARALAASKKGERESAYIKAIQAYYEGLPEPVVAAPGADAAAAADASCHGPRLADPKGRAACYLREMEQVVSGHPGDAEAEAFLALALLSTAPPGDPALANQKRAASILERRYAEQPHHPGLAHYLIHSYDYPPLATKGLAAANAYATMQPWVPHALHMPSHIYTRLGMWRENIAANRASAQAARAYAASHHPDAASFEELHALDYMIYGHLQTGQDREAKRDLDRLAQIKRTHPETDFVVGYAFGAMPARYALERRQWKEATALAMPPMPFWGKLPFAEGHLVYARAVGAAKTGDLAAAGAAADRLKELSASVKDPRFRYFADQMELQRQAALGLIALAGGRKDEAIGILRAAAAKEDSLGKHPVSPGAILPIRELLAEALIDCDRPAEALTEYEASLAIYPRRFNGVAGAARAAAAAGKADVARRYYGDLVALSKGGDGTRPEVKWASEYLAGR
ncbi:MAG: tetratricopeptide repeat protein [Candidatus Eiseniibacteriota bacterium]